MDLVVVRIVRLDELITCTADDGNRFGLGRSSSWEPTRHKDDDVVVAAEAAAVVAAQGRRCIIILLGVFLLAVLVNLLSKKKVPQVSAAGSDKLRIPSHWAVWLQILGD